MQEQNIYYSDLIEGKILRPLIIRKVRKGGFYEYMKSIGKFGGKIRFLSCQTIVRSQMF